MSTLGDLIVEHDGPYEPGEALPDWADEEYAAAQLNALRDELIELRAIKAWRDRQAQCSWSGDCEGTDECPGCQTAAARRGGA